jgi:hypothetical protein
MADSRLTDRLTGIMADSRLTDRLTDIMASRQVGRQAERQAGRQIEKVGKQTDRQTIGLGWLLILKTNEMYFWGIYEDHVLKCLAILSVGNPLATAAHSLPTIVIVKLGQQ